MTNPCFRSSHLQAGSQVLHVQDSAGQQGFTGFTTTGAKGSLVLNSLIPDWVVNLLTPDWLETHTEPAVCHGSLLLRLGRHTKPETKPNQRRTQNQPAHRVLRPSASHELGPRGQLR